MSQAKLFLMILLLFGASSWAQQSGPIHWPAATRDGWPLTFFAGTPPLVPVLADLDGDGRQEIVFYIWNRGLYVVHGDDGAVLPGWPVNPNPPTFRVTEPPLVGDIDGDDRLDVVAYAGSGLFQENIWAFSADGQVKPGFPIAGLSVSFPGVEDFEGPMTLVDLTGDGALEIVVAQGNQYVSGPTPDVIYVYAFTGTGQLVPGWPVAFDMTPAYSIHSGSTICSGDLDFDGQNEVVVSFSKYSGPGGSSLAGGSVWVINGSGTVRAGWPYVVPDFFYYPVVGDLDNDGECEIIGRGPGYIRVLGLSGSMLQSYYYVGAGRPMALGDVEGDGFLELVTPWNQLRLYHWPATLAGESSVFPHELYQGITIADFDGDGLSEVVSISSQTTVPLGFNPYLHVFDSQLQELPDWPIELHCTTGYNDPYATAVSDFDLDGDLELVYTDKSGYVPFSRAHVNVLDIPNPNANPATVQWPMYGHDQYTSFNYHVQPPRVSYLRADANRDGQVDVTDPIQLLGTLFLAQSNECPAALDANADTQVDITDAVHLLNYLYGLGPSAIAAPFPACGPAPPAGLLKCAFFGCP